MTIIICFVLDGPVSNNSGSSLDSSVIIVGVMGGVILLLIIIVLLCIVIVCKRRNRKGTPPVDSAINPNVNNLSHGVSTGKDRAATSSTTSEVHQPLHDDTSNHQYDTIRHSYLLHQNTAANITTSTNTSDTEIQIHVTVDQSHNTQTTCTPHPPAASSAKSNGVAYSVVNQPKSDENTGNAIHAAVDQSHMTIHSPFTTNGAKPNDGGNYKYGVVNQPKSDYPTHENSGNAIHAAVDQSHMRNTQTIHSPFITNGAKPNDEGNYKYGVVNQPKSDYPTHENTGNAIHAAVDQSHMRNTQTIHSPFITNSAKPNDEGNYKYGVVNQPKSDYPTHENTGNTIHAAVDQSYMRNTQTIHSPFITNGAKPNDEGNYKYGVVNQPKSDYPTHENTGNTIHAAVDQSYMRNTQTIHSPFITNGAKPNDGGNYKYGVVNQPKSDDPNFFKSTI